MTLWLAVNAAVMIRRSKGHVRDFEAEYVLPWLEGWSPAKFRLLLVERDQGRGYTLPPMSDEDNSSPSFLKQLQDALNEAFNTTYDRTLKALEDRFGPAEPKAYPLNETLLDDAVALLHQHTEGIMKLQDKVKGLNIRLDGRGGLRDELQKELRRLQDRADEQAALRATTNERLRLDRDRLEAFGKTVEVINKACSSLAVRVNDLENQPVPQQDDWAKLHERVLRLEMAPVPQSADWVKLQERVQRQEEIGRQVVMEVGMLTDRLGAFVKKFEAFRDGINQAVDRADDRAIDIGRKLGEHIERSNERMTTLESVIANWDAANKNISRLGRRVRQIEMVLGNLSASIGDLVFKDEA